MSASWFRRFRRFLAEVAVASWVLSFLSPALLLGQPPGPQGTTEKQRKKISAHFIGDQKIDLDGCLCEEIWEAAEVADGFLQAAPVEAAKPTEPTELRFLYNRENLFVGATMFDSETGKLITNELKRDFGVGDTDIIIILIDSFNDQRNGLAFEANPGGAQHDTQGFDGGRSINNDWNAVWYVKTQVLEDRWVAEFRIPFKTLRFQNEPVQTFGLNAFRNVRRKNERTYWSLVPRQFSVFATSFAGELTGLEGINPGHDFRVKPFVVANVNNGSRSNRKTDAEIDGGVDVKYGLTSGLTFDASYRTDFSQVEVDEQQVNLTRFSLFFPEKREFFLENQGFFQVGDLVGRFLGTGPAASAAFLPFFSRRIGLTRGGEPVPILGGVRLTGKSKGFGIGALTMQTEDSDLDPGTNFTVLRGYRDVLDRSYVGGFFLSRDSGVPGDSNRVGGVDANFSLLGNRLNWISYAMKSWTPGLEGDDLALRTALNYRETSKDFKISFGSLGENFRDDLGFLQRTGVRISSASGGYRWRPWPTSYLREFNPNFNADYIMDSDNKILNRWFRLGFKVETGGGGSLEFARFWEFERLQQPFRLPRGVEVEPGDHGWNNSGIFFNSDPERRVFGNLRYGWGDFYNGRRRFLQSGLNWRKNEHFRTGATWTVNKIELPSGDLTTHLIGTRVDIYFNTKVYLNAFLQYNNSSNLVLSTVRFNIMHHQLSDLFIVYTERRNTGILRLLEEDDRALIIKFTHLFNF